MTLALEFKNTTSDYTGTGAGLGGRLTSAQADNNNWLIKQAVETLQAAAGKTIDGITAVGNQLTITYTDATTDVITIPTATWTWRGEWDAGVSYAANDLFSEGGSIYLVLLAHTSASSFDAGETSTAGDLYQKILTIPSIPVYEVTTDTFTPTIDQANYYFRCTHADGCTVTIPDNADVAFPLWTELHFRDANSNTGGTGLLTIESSTAVTINVPSGYSATAATQHATLGLKKIATDEWDLFGLLATVSV